LIRDRIVWNINVSKMKKKNPVWSVGTKERGCRGVLGLALFPERHIYPTQLKYNP
jgi:hypothetical protein